MKAFRTLKKTGIVGLLVLAAACSSDSDGGSGGTLPSGTYIKSNFDGSSWQTFEVAGQSATVAMSNGTGAERTILINGTGNMSGTDSMVINLMGIDAPGTYTIDADSGGVLAYVVTASSLSYDTSNCDGASGTVVITAINDTKVEGTFSFTGKVDENCSDSKTFTEGSFRGVFSSN